MDFTRDAESSFFGSISISASQKFQQGASAASPFLYRQESLFRYSASELRPKKTFSIVRTLLKLQTTNETWDLAYNI
jgi:hypothetical protein